MGPKYNNKCPAEIHQEVPDIRRLSVPEDLASNPVNCKTPIFNCTSTNQCEQWFKTWPERCIDKGKLGTESVRRAEGDQCTFADALAQLSLVYSPISKRLHIINDEPSIDCNETVSNCRAKQESESISSSMSYTGDIDTNLLNSDQNCDTDTGVNDRQPRKKIVDFLKRNLFAWKIHNGDRFNSWNFFAKSSKSSGQIIASSTALIQNGRPSNLPAKSEEEEKRHKREYHEIVTAAKLKDYEKILANQRLQQMQLEQEEQQIANAKHFSDVVIPHWDEMLYNDETRELWWFGLPSCVRGRVWQLTIGNALQISPKTYELCLDRAKKCTEVLSNGDHLPASGGNNSGFDAIELDISRTFPQLGIFQRGGPYSELLYSLLTAFVCYKPEIGYVQGMSYIGAILILNMDVLDAFTCFANLLSQPLHLAAFTLDQMRLQAYYDAYNEALAHNLPKLHRHFNKSGLTADLYLLDWIYTVFAKAMPLDATCRVWDIFLRDGYEFIFRTALGILHLHQQILLEMDFLHGSQFLTHLPEDLSADDLFRSIQTMTTTVGKVPFNQLVHNCFVSLNSGKNS